MIIIFETAKSGLFFNFEQKSFSIKAKMPIKESIFMIPA
jgi:hypothetical protein